MVAFVLNDGSGGGEKRSGTANNTWLGSELLCMPSQARRNQAFAAGCSVMKSSDKTEAKTRLALWAKRHGGETDTARRRRPPRSSGAIGILRVFRGGAEGLWDLSGFLK